MTKAKSAPIYSKGTFYEISCNGLKTDTNQPRKHFDPDALKDLVESIKTHGVLQPILFRQESKGELFIVAGERRLRAAKEAGIKNIPAILVEGNTEEIALVENLLREDLTAIELAESLKRIMEDHDYTQDQLTGIICKAKSTISEILSLNSLPEKIRDECRTNPSIPRKTLIRIARIKKTENQVKAFSKYKETKTSQKTRGPKGKRKGWSEKFSSRCEELTGFYSDIAIERIDNQARADIKTQIQDLMQSLVLFIDRIQEAPEYVEPEKKTKTKASRTKTLTKPPVKKHKK